MLAKVTVVKIVSYGTSVCGDVAACIGRPVMNDSVLGTILIGFYKTN